jgi:2-polyprenyl-3-methyl-5-hydroxy-6-metoxy-1,4-benzoquinol methylase
MPVDMASVDMAKLDAFMGKMVGEMGAAMNASLILLGDRLGLYKAMAGEGPMTARELARKTHTDERHLREWLNAQAAGGLVTYHAGDNGDGTYTLPPEQAMALAEEGSPAFLCGAYQVIASIIKDVPKVEESFRTGEGLGWHEHDVCLFRGTERFFRPGYVAHLVSEWIPALHGVKEKLEAGGVVADVGCGHGSSTILMAQAFPKSKFFGFDYHDASISAAQLAAEEAGVADRITFEVAAAKSFPKHGQGYDLVTFFDCLHDMGDPVGASRHVKETLKPGGTWMVVEPIAGDRVEQNLNPVGRIFYCASTVICTPASKAQEVGMALGAQAGEARLRDVVLKGGFSHVRRAAETPFNMVLEVR